MATNHNINVNFRSRGSGGGSQSNLKTSAKRGALQIKANANSKSPIPNIISKTQRAMGVSGVSGFGALKTAGVAGAIAFAGVSLANKVADVVMDVYSASTGEEILVGNIRKVRSYVLNPVKYAKDSIYGYGILQSRIIKRQNYENDYHRELSGNLIVGNQYGSKR